MSGEARWCRDEDLEELLAEGWEEAGPPREVTTHGDGSEAYHFLVRAR